MIFYDHDIFNLLILFRTDKAVLATSGMRADQVTLHKILDIRIRQYYQTHRRQISTPSIAQMLSNTLYYKRFFPYYTFNVLGGIDEEGKGCVYGYDAIGSFQRYPVACSGTANALIQPILDNQVSYNFYMFYLIFSYAFFIKIEREHQLGQKPWFDITQDEALKLVQDAFTSAGERDIYTGDSVYISIIDKNGVKNITFELKED